ncbi:type II toxin-antitoxin system RelE/ParE family toxin [Microbulbifer sp. ZKSA002]|uniref:type II toxin-antitoxin system RelE/ParE family toxin n=1 Tax=Microbulbifer sp. ZKSA002 TaxID=3243388 RepID=UPI00403A6FBD
MARIFLTGDFAQIAVDEGMSVDSLREAAARLAQGSHDGHIGKNIYKQRVQANGRGKRGGARAVVAFRSQEGDRVFFLYGYSKKKYDNISKDAVRGLEIMAAGLIRAPDEVIEEQARKGNLIEIKVPAEETAKD